MVVAIASASVTVSPASVQVKPGGQVQFTAMGSADGVVIWGLVGAGCSGIGCGEISSQGLYTAPSNVPSPPTVVVAALSLSDLSQVGTATITIGSAAGVQVSLSPSSATVAVNGKQQFTATVTGATNTAVTWAVSGTGCVAGSCGSVSPTGLYTAPSKIPASAIARVTATSVADKTKSASASIVIQSFPSVSVTVSPSIVQINTGQQRQFTATVTGNVNTAVTWSLSGSGCAGAACGIITSTGLYTAPANAPSPATVMIRATSAVNPAVSGTATATIVAIPKLSISPTSPHVQPTGQIQFAVSGPQSGLVVWSLSGTGCAGVSCGTISSTGLYTAPSTIPNPNTVTVTVTSLTGGAISGSTTITIGSPNSIAVSVSPSDPSVRVGGTQQFTATVTGSSNKSVSWRLSGVDCAGVTCGTITASGLYTAPSSAPQPPFITVTAISSADPSKSSNATVTVSQQVSVSISPTAANVVEGKTQQFKATVTGTQNTGVNWSVSGVGCSASGCGTITPNGLYTAPDSIPTRVVVTATSAVDFSASASATVTISAPVVVMISPVSAVVAAGTSQQFHASVAGSKTTTVTWAVRGAGCSGSACGTVSATGLYTAPANLPSPSTVSVSATAQANNTSSASSSITLVATNNAKLIGHYAFFFSGFDSGGIFQEVGSFTANGAGLLASGEEDLNSFAGPSTRVAIHGNYQVTSDNRGTLNISSLLGAHTYKFALNTLGTKGRFISFDSSGVRGSGFIERQDTSAFDPSVLANGYVLGLSGMDASGGRVGALCLIFPNGAGFIAGSTCDVNDNGSVAPTYSSFSGRYAVDASGRGTAALMIPGLGSGVLDFAFYVVSANELLITSVDPVAQNSLIFGGTAKAQNGAPFSSASFSGGAIFGITGTNGSSPQDMVGRFGFDGSSNVTVNFDQNSGGDITVGGLMTGAYALELNGRGTLNLDNAANGNVMVWYVYATGPNQGFVMDASTPAAGIGEMTTQTIVTPLSSSDILGSYFFGSGDSVQDATPLYSGVSSFDGGSSLQGQGLENGVEEISRTSALSANQVLNGTYSVSAVSNNGRGSILLTSPSGGTIAVWVASSNQFVGLDIDATVTQPTILFFEQ